MEPSTLPEATSMARFTAHTWTRLTTTVAMPIDALSMVCSRLPRHTFHSQRMMSRVV